MLRFIDLSEPGRPLAAFFCEITHKFLENSHGDHTFICMGEVWESTRAATLTALLPRNFFDRNSKCQPPVSQ